MDITHLTPDAEGSIEWPSFSNDKKAVVTWAHLMACTWVIRR